MLGTRTAAWGIVALFALVHAFVPHRARGQSDHRLVWRTLTTKNFAIHYHEPLGLLARQIASQAESINHRLETALGLQLHQRVEVVLEDSDDDANGFAVAVPYNAITLRAVAPEDMSPLSDYDDWPTMLLTHEHSHVLHLEQASGIPRLLTALLGRFYSPQNSLPRWIIEGLAVVQESAHTSAGRLNSSLFEMYLRMDSLEHRQLSLDLLGFDGEPWPHGTVRYLYGGALLQYIVERHGQRALGRFVEAYGRRLVPYGINRALKRATGQTFTELYGAFLADLRPRAERVRAAVEARGRVEGVRLTQHGELTRTPRFVSPDEVVYSVADARHVPQIRRLSWRDPSRSERVTRVPAVAQVSRVPGTPRIVYSSTQFHRGTYAFSELSEVGLDGGRRRRLTYALRAREPDVSPDGKRVAFVTHGAGTSHLVIAELADVEHTRTIAVRSRRLEQVFTPRWSPDGRRIAYSAWSRGGYRDIWVLDVASGARTRLTYDRAVDRGPVFAPDGETLYFSSDRSGVANLYAYRFADQQLTQITNVLGGAFQPDVSPDGRTIVYVGYGSRGFDLYALSVADGAALAAETHFEHPPAPRMPEPLTAASTAYAPYRSMLPRSIEISTDEAYGATRLVLGASGRDAVGWHAWALQLSQSVEGEQRDIDLAYAYRRPRFPVIVRAAVRDQLRTDLIAKGRRRQWDARAWSLSLGSSFGFPRALRSLSLRGEYALGFLEPTQAVSIDYDPNYPPPRLPATGLDTRTSWTLTHASSQRQPFDISRSWGHVASVSTAVRDPWLGSRTRSLSLSWRFEQFFRLGFRESVLALAYTGAWNQLSVLGGYPAQLVPIQDYIAGTRSAPGDYARLRGFPRRAGDRLEVVQLEYRILLARINRGIQTLPLFARRVHAALFADTGDVWSGPFALSRVGVGVGGELRLDWSTDYGNNDLTLRGGLARGVTQGGEWQWYTTIARPF